MSGSMRIRRLELVGFKSFVSRTRFEFHDGITAIVGPNGCGKSNIVDAIRWVLGEMSPSHLRGQAMDDVIFNGNERTGPLGMAEVSLALERTGSGPIWDVPDADDQESDLHKQLSGVSEITVTRRYFRSGESQYMINRVPCRLRDITELFLGSGLGTKAYAIIEQGRVEQLVNAKPDALRLFVEEAAGTTRYRSRRIVAERKMARTRDHLVRLSDVIHEIERQTNSLTRQAKRAEEYRRYRDELRTLELRAARKRHGALQGQVGEAEGRLQPLEATEAQLLRELHDSEAAAGAARADVRTAEEGQRELEGRIVELRLETEGAAQRLAYLEEALLGLQQRQADSESERRRLAESVERTTGERDEAEERLRRIESDARSLVSRRSALESELSGQVDAVARAEGAVEDAKTEAVEALTGQLKVQSQVAAAEGRREDVERRLTQARAARARLAELEARARDDSRVSSDAVTQLRQDVEAGEKAHRDSAAAADEAGRIEAAAAREAEQARGRVSELSSRLSFLEELKARWEGCSRGVRSVVEEAVPGVRGVLADVLSVPEEYEAAVAAALGPRLQCLIVEDHDQSIKALEALESSRGGRASFLPLDPRSDGGAGVAQLPADGAPPRLSDLVDVKGEYRPLAEALLGNVVLVDGLAEALALWHRNGTRVTAVTRRGEQIDPVGVLSGGSERPLEETLLSRNREIRDIRAALASASAAAEQAAERRRELAERVSQLGQLAAEATKRLQALRVALASALKDEERLQHEHRRAVVEREAGDLEVRGLEQERSEAERELEVLATTLDVSTKAKEEGDRRLAEAQEALASVRRGSEELRAVLAGLASEEAARLERRGEAREACRRAQERAHDLQSRLVQVGDLGEQLAAEASRLAGERTAIEQERGRKLAELETAQGAAAASAEQARATSEEAARCEAKAVSCRESLETCREERRSIDVHLAEQRAALGHLVESMKEKYQYDLSRSRTEEDLEESGLPEAEVAERVDELRARLARIGDVNVGAIEELDELRGRHEYLTRQRDDVQRSIDDLKRTIAKLNRLSRTRFQETFDQANEKLGDLFPRLFPGGRARLVLSEPDDGSEPGVEIQVQPVGKKLGSLTLLSGGEKALTAVSLILSLFMIRPTPFCVLDEVDAPLDDANVGRFDQLVREISKISQFVLITHNKRTMEAADGLYGITMEQAGVSKVVSVRLKQAA